MSTSADVRDKLLEALELDLVGPKPNWEKYAYEELTQAPSKWYLTGFLVPVGLPMEKKIDDTGDDVLEQEIGQKIDSEDSQLEKLPSKRVPFPSSMGLSFLINEEIQEIEAEISWGEYHPVEVEQGMDEKPLIIWKRHPQNYQLTIPLNANTINLNNSGLKLIIINRNCNQDTKIRSISVFLVNYRDSQENSESSYLFQVRMSLKNKQGFIARYYETTKRSEETDWDELVADLQYRQEYEYAVGHNVSVVAKINNNLCQEIETTWLPECPVPNVVPATFEDVELTMETIGNAESAQNIIAMLMPMVTNYQDWIEGQKQQLKEEPTLKQDSYEVGQTLLDKANQACQRMERGLKLLEQPDIREAFQIANRVIASSRRQQLSIESGKSITEIAPPKWRPFQLAYILLNIEGIAYPESKEREIVDLLYFPTGGGKTEAYLGLAAFAIVLRRFRNPGLTSAGLSVLMRYTLRLLTLDQLERASRLVCALEIERINNVRLGAYPFEIGLWVGAAATPNKMGKKGAKNDNYSARAKTRSYQRDSSKGSPIPLERCPWCAQKFTAESIVLVGANNKPDADHPVDLKLTCRNRSCHFRGDRYLPIVVIDEAIYRRLPCFMIATVDKFANLPWVGQTAHLFGKVTNYQEGIGFFSLADEPNIKGKRLPNMLPPPDLIIQDELHLISGPLGTMVGLYETAIDFLSTRSLSDPEKARRQQQISNGQHTEIRPKIIASTATVRRAEKQIKLLFDRPEVEIFPPPGPDRHDSFFAQTNNKAQDWENSARLYLGVAAQGRNQKVILLRVYLALLAAAQKEWELANNNGIKPNPADPYMTIMGYFNSLRELGGCRRIVEDEINPQLQNYGTRRIRWGEKENLYFANRKIDDQPEELTSRVSTNEVAQTKNNLTNPFISRKSKGEYLKDTGVDVALATNMISVGLDIVRLGLMVVLGQPKSAAEYIQSTSRVGRDALRPGLVVTILNLHRPRDRSHYERFITWHQTFYRSVEATSVTPFSARAIDRGLAGIMIAMVRLGIQEMTGSLGASDFIHHREQIEQLLRYITMRAQKYNPDLKLIEEQIEELLDQWQKRIEAEIRIQYQKEIEAVPKLLISPFDDNEEKKSGHFLAPRSLRDVESTSEIWIY